MDRFSQLALSAARMAEADSGISIADEPDRVGAAVATGIGGLKAFEDCLQLLIERGPDRTSPFSIIQIIPNMAAAWISMELGTQGPLATETTACAASNMAIGDGMDAIRLGRADAMFCGGTEAPITRVGIAGFTAMRALSQRNDDPEARLAPVRRRPRRLRHGRGGRGARSRGARARAGARGEDLRRAARLRRLLRREARDRARSHREEPGARDADGVRGRGDLAERRGLRERARHVDAARRPRRDARAQARARRGERVRGRPSPRRRARPGHTLGAAGAVEAIFTIFALQHGLLPPTINYETPDPTCDLDYIPNDARPADLKIGVSNSFGFGGHNACVVFRRWDEP